MVVKDSEIITENLCNGDYFADMKGNDLMDRSDAEVRAADGSETAINQRFERNSFVDFVVIKLEETPSGTIAYKSMKSFLDAVRGYVDFSIGELLNLWMASMIYNGMADSSRKRYFAKLGTLYNEYCAGKNDTDNPFVIVKAGFDKMDVKTPDAFVLLCARMDRIVNTLLKDARSRPVLTIFFYLLFHASSDIIGAIDLKIDDYDPLFAQLDSLIDTSAFHHRRKYVFNLGQSQKRMPQLTAEVTTGIDCYLRSRGFDMESGFSGSLITALWIVKAHSLGIGLPDIRAVVSSVPDEFCYLSLVSPSCLTSGQAESIKRRVADAFSPAVNRWYAMKLRRKADYESMCAAMKEELTECYHKIEFFYPERVVVKRQGKKMVREHVPYIPDIVFFNIHPLYVNDIDSTVRRNGIGWVFRILNASDSEYSVIDRGSMLSFEKVVGQFTPDMKIEISDRAPMDIGRKVRITGGIMSGYEGMIYDIKEPGDTAGRIFCIKLSSSQFVRLQVSIEEIYIEPV